MKGSNQISLYSNFIRRSSRTKD